MLKTLNFTQSRMRISKIFPFNYKIQGLNGGPKISESHSNKNNKRSVTI